MPRKSRNLRCKATSKTTGQPCRRWAMDGALVCAHHGGRAPLAQNKAQERIDDIQVTVLTRLEALVPLAVEAMEQVLANPDEKASDRIKAAEAVMDRFIARKVHAEIDDNQEVRDLDNDIDRIIAEQEETG